MEAATILSNMGVLKMNILMIASSSFIT